MGEVFIANVRIMKNANKDKIRQVYLCFSPKVMTQAEKINMCLYWPPRDVLYVRFSPDSLKQTQVYWEEDIPLFWLTKEAFLDRYYPS